MIPSDSVEVDARLDVLLATRARAASDGRLVVDVIIGAAAMTAALVWRPFAWVALLSAGCCFAAFGAWGITDRILHERRDPDRWTPVLRLGRGAAAIIGGLAGLSLILSACALALGTWIS